MLTTIAPQFASTNPAATELDNSSAGQLQAMHGDAGGNWTIEELADIKPLKAGIAVISIPHTTEQPEIMAAGQKMKFSQPAIGSYALTTQLFGAGLGVQIDNYNSLGPVQEVIDGIVTSMAQVGEKHIKRLAINELYNLGVESRPNYDGKTYFATDHPVDPHDRTRKSKTLGTTTYANTFDNTSLTPANLAKALSYCLTLPLEDGENAPVTKVTLFVPAALGMYAMQLIHAMSIATNYSGGSDGYPVASGENVVGADDNIFKTANGRIFQIDVKILPQYPTTVSVLTVTNYHWFLYTHLSPMFNVRFQEWYTFSELVGESDYPVFIERNRLHKINANLVVGGPLIPQTLLRFRSGTT